MMDILKVFKALSDETRLRIVNLVLERECSVCEIMQAMRISQTRASRGLTVLHNAGILKLRRDGLWVLYSIDEEGIKGARIRAKKALVKTRADFGVGLEAALMQVDKYWFDSGWVIVLDKKGRCGVATSPRIETPKKMMKYIKQGLELGEIDDILFNQKNTKHGPGHFGLLTDGVISRDIWRPCKHKKIGFIFI